MRTESVLGLGPHGFHRIAYTEWGEARSGRTLICVHGMTRNGRDFDRLAAALAERWHVVCPDMPGRGRSDWLPAADYNFPQYMADLTSLIGRLNVTEIDWVGTSLGGIIGMQLAAQPQSPIRRLVINDIGPFIPKAGRLRLAEYVGKDPHFAGLEELEAYLRKVHASFGPLSDQHWRHMALQGYRRLEGGGFALHYDPGVAQALQSPDLTDIDMWASWDAIQCPVLVLRGADSDILLAETAAEMQRRGPKAKLVELPGIGHAPALMAEEQIALVRDWLTKTA
ncbi:MAG: alpha/beta fold hydrolase [Dongiaceae bacterium]